MNSFGGQSSGAGTSGSPANDGSGNDGSGKVGPDDIYRDTSSCLVYGVGSDKTIKQFK